MPFTVVTDTSANLPTPLLKQNGVPVLPFTYLVEGEPKVCLDTETFDYGALYEAMDRGVKITTAQINPQTYVDCFRPLLTAGQDVVFVGMSSGISGSLASAEIARAELAGEFPGRTLCVVDTKGASLGEGIAVVEAIRCRDGGMSAAEAAEHLRAYCKRIYQVFTVDDLMYLRRGGRLSNAAAVVGTLLGIKPLLKGDPEGRIVSFGKARSRKAVMEAMVKKYAALAAEPEDQQVCIAHVNCLADAERLAEAIRAVRPPKDILLLEYEPVTGSHLGPRALALFFLGDENVRTK
ncbi:MAG: DegV family protein [Oscillospiraceae bacterium]|nr:DegV family protein [Oscillospiraceae bacterium]